MYLISSNKGGWRGMPASSMRWGTLFHQTGEFRQPLLHPRGRGTCILSNGVIESTPVCSPLCAITQNSEKLCNIIFETNVFFIFVFKICYLRVNHCEKLTVVSMDFLTFIRDDYVCFTYLSLYQVPHQKKSCLPNVCCICCKHVAEPLSTPLHDVETLSWVIIPIITGIYLTYFPFKETYHF